MRILVKFPTRGRPARFLTTLRGWMENENRPWTPEAPADHITYVSYLVTYDADDVSMTEAVVNQAMAMRPSIVFSRGQCKTKIEACNDAIKGAAEWDVLLLISDDMFCRRKGWEEIIRSKMVDYFPDTDGVLWFNDGSRQREIMTLSCIGRKYYERDGYIYHPSYSSFFCDNEATDVARSRGKLVFIEQGIATHEHPSWGGGMKPDATYARNNKYWAADSANYQRRKAAGFPA